MKYDILKDFPGSQDGRFTEHFMAGTQAELSDYLAEIVVREGWARPAGVGGASVPPIEIDNKAIVTDGMRRGRKAKA